MCVLRLSQEEGYEWHLDICAITKLHFAKARIGHDVAPRYAVFSFSPRLSVHFWLSTSSSSLVVAKLLHDSDTRTCNSTNTWEQYIPLFATARVLHTRHPQDSWTSYRHTISPRLLGEMNQPLHRPSCDVATYNQSLAT